MVFDETKRYVDILCEYKVTANQFLLAYLLYMDRVQMEAISEVNPSDRGFTLLYKYVSSCGVYNKNVDSNVAWSMEDIRKLVDIGFLTNSNSTIDQALPDNLEVTPLFIDLVSPASKGFEDFWDLYPSFIPNFTHPNLPKIPLKAVNKDEIEIIFNKKINTDKLYKEIMEVVEWAKREGRINTNIKNFLSGELYKSFREEMSRNEGGDSDRVIGI